MTAVPVTTENEGRGSRVTEYSSTWADISPCGAYRYQLGRRWARGECLRVVMLNPSKADADQDDRTIGRCVSFAQREGFGGLVVFNLYALRSTYPAALWQHDDPVGPLNDATLLALTNPLYYDQDTPILCGWGVNARPDRVAEFRRLTWGADLRCLGTTQSGAPKHPLYIKGDQPLVPYPAAT